MLQQNDVVWHTRLKVGPAIVLRVSRNVATTLWGDGSWVKIPVGLLTTEQPSDAIAVVSPNEIKPALGG